MLRRLVGPATTYYLKVLSYNPIAYWPLWEASGDVAHCLVNSAQNGAYTGVTLGQPGIGDGRTCPLFNGATDFVDVYTTTFRDAFNGAEGTAIIWAKVFDVGVWTDETSRYWLRFLADTQNTVWIGRIGLDERYHHRYEAGNVPETVNKTGITTTDWMLAGITWSKTADEFKAFYNGTQISTTQTGLGTWVGTLASAFAVIGATENDATAPFFGWLAHCAVCDRSLTPTQMADLAIV